MLEIAKWPSTFSEALRNRHVDEPPAIGEALHGKGRITSTLLTVAYRPAGLQKDGARALVHDGL